MKFLKPSKKCIKSLQLVNATVCGTPVYQRLEWRVTQLPSWPGNVRLCYYCPLGDSIVPPLCLLAIGRFHLWASGDPQTVVVKSPN